MLKKAFPQYLFSREATRGEMGAHSQRLKKLGFERVGLHATKYFLDYREKLAQNLHGKTLGELIRMRVQPLTIGAMDLKSFHPLLHRKYFESSFAGMS